MKSYLTKNWKPVLLATLATSMFVGFILAAGGCSTVQGFAEDVGSMAEITQKAMAQDK